MWLDCQSASKKNGMILIVRSLVFDNFHTLSADLDIELCLESDLDSQKLDIEGESTLDSSQSSISVNRLDIGPISRLDGLLCSLFCPAEKHDMMYFMAPLPSSS